jgi:hypothetical protein
VKTDQEVAELLKQKVADINAILLEAVGRGMDVAITRLHRHQVYRIGEPTRDMPIKFSIAIKKTERL